MSCGPCASASIDCREPTCTDSGATLYTCAHGNSKPLPIIKSSNQHLRHTTFNPQTTTTTCLHFNLRTPPHQSIPRHSDIHDVQPSSKAPLQRVQSPLLRPPGGHHSRPCDRRRHVPLGSPDPGARRDALRRRHFPCRTQVPQGLSSCAAEDEVPDRSVAPQWYVNTPPIRLKCEQTC